MEGKVFIVTGSSAGIGAATVVELASKGARVTVHGRRPDRVAAIAEQCKAASPAGHEACTVIGDIEDCEVRKQLVQATLDKFGRIDGLVNNAGWASVGGWEKEDLKAMQTMLDVHVIGPYDLCRQVLPHLKETKGSIVMISSVAGLRAAPGVVAYITAKHAMDGMMKALSVELAKQGVRVNAINPGMIATEIFRYAEMKEMQSEKEFDPQNVHPNGRVGEAREVASCITFLLSPEASMVTGIEMPVDGGLLSAMMWK